MTVDEFRGLLSPVTECIAGRPLDAARAEELTERFPPEGDLYRAIEAACHLAIAEGWMCAEGGEGRRFGRIIEPTPETGNLSVDVVRIADRQGPHHRHPTGEVCMVMPVTPTAKFDGNGRGWCVYEPDTAHVPTVTDGDAIVLYLLPDGRIEFTA